MSTNGKYLAWKEKLNSKPADANDRGSGPWRVFTLDRRGRRILPSAPRDFTPVRPLTQCEGWHVEPTTNGYVWRIVGPGGTRVNLDDRSGLYLTRVNQLPRCYTFLKPCAGKPVRLAVGHQWGVSLYELKAGKVRLVRLMAGHEGEVMAVAPSHDGRLLLTASRDQTIAAWSLEDWPNQRELGASFVAGRSGKVVVKHVDPGSPAWEAGLTDGDEIVMIVSSDRDVPRGWVYDPEKHGLKKYGFSMEITHRCTQKDVLARLAHAEPNREHIFVWRHRGKEQVQLTTVRQRPLWRFFPTRAEEGGDWIIWRWRDFFYDTTSPRPDRLVGWQVNPEDVKRRPVFHPLSRFKGLDQKASNGFHNPERVWKYVKLPFQDPKKVLFPDIEPPRVRLSMVQAPGRDRDLILQASVQPNGNAPQQRLVRVVLWLDDWRFEKSPSVNGKTGAIETRIVVPRSRLRQGVNELTLAAFNAAGGRGEDRLIVEFSDKARTKPTLYALCVGINDYSQVMPGKNLACPKRDAEVLANVFEQHAGSRLFRHSKVALLTERKATASEITGRLRELAQTARPDDCLVVFLSGHGQTTNTQHAYAPGSFQYVCADSDPNRDHTLLPASRLYDLLSRIPCRKLVLLDCCHSGAVISSPIRDLNREGAKFLIFSACKPEQDAIEPNLNETKKVPGLRDLKHGLFTEGILAAVGGPGRNSAKGRQQAVTARVLAGTIRHRIAELLPKLQKSADAQTPVFEPVEMPAVNVLCENKPLPPAPSPSRSRSWPFSSSTTGPGRGGRSASVQRLHGWSCWGRSRTPPSVSC
jgi:hypothetical protein